MNEEFTADSHLTDMPISIQELADRIKARLVGGDPKRILVGAAPLGSSRPDQVSPFTDPRYREFLETTKAGAVILDEKEAPETLPQSTARLHTKDPERAFIETLNIFHPVLSEPPGIHEQACVHPSAKLGAEVYVGPFAIICEGAQIGPGTSILGHAYVGRNCRLGSQCVIHPQAVLYNGVELGDRVIIHSGTAIGPDGFGYKFRDGRHMKVPQVGIVKIGNDVEIGSNTCIDRAAMGQTEIGDGSKIDNLVQIAHNARIGKHVILCGHVGLAGSVDIQDYAMLGAQVGVADHITIGTAAQVAAKSGVHKSVEPNKKVFGFPADDFKSYWRQVVAMRKLPDLIRKVRDLESKIRDLEEQHGG